MTYLFWAAMVLIIYTYIGYPIILGILVKLKSILVKQKKEHYEFDELPEVTLIIACFNEAELLDAKIQNTLQLNYPENRLKVFFVTDGSNDESMDIIKKYPSFQLHHKDERLGKNAAVNRVIPLVKTPIIVFCDANTFLNNDAIFHLVRHYKNKNVGAIAGEKRIWQGEQEAAAGSGEGAYWKYESQLKKWDSELHSVVGAAGELFSVRTHLFKHVPKNVLIEDFRLSMEIAQAGYKVVYEPDAYAMETSSASIAEEQKRKVRISAGGLIEIWHFMPLLNIFKYGLLSFQYVSHRMLRWTLTPLSLLIVFIANILLLNEPFYQLIFVLQMVFYALAIFGYVMQNRKFKYKVLFIPYYFAFMNISVYQGLFRLIKGNQKVAWDKAKRAVR